MIKKLKRLSGRLLEKLLARFPITPRVNNAVTSMMVTLNLWVIDVDLFYQLNINPKRMKRLHKLMLKYQQFDNLKHAPCCPANHFHRSRLVFYRCTCGTKREMYSN
jgi:hypothetical protein